MNRLRWFRQRAHLTQAQLAKRVGTSGAAISNIELGKGYPRPETQKKIAAIFHVEPEIIFDKPLPRQRPLPDSALPQYFISKDGYLQLSCRRCHKPITGLIWNPVKYELIIGKMPRPAKVHINGFFYHEDCLKEKKRIEIAYPDLSQK